MLGDFSGLEPENRNILHWMLTDPTARTLLGGTWADEARRMVSLFRPAHDLWPGEPAFADLVERLRANCPEFAGWWAAHGIAAPISGTKRLNHPTLGTVRYDYVSFQADDDPDLKLALYTQR